MYVNIYILCQSETLGNDRCTASTDNGKDRCMYSLVQYSIIVLLVKIVVQ